MGAEPNKGKKGQKKYKNKLASLEDTLAQNCDVDTTMLGHQKSKSKLLLVNSLAKPFVAHSLTD